MNLINETVQLFQDKQIVVFFNWLIQDRRRLSNVRKILNILIKDQDNQLTFVEISEKTKVRQPTLSIIIRKMRLLRMIADYDIENIVYRTKEVCVKKNGTKEKGCIEYATKNDERRFYHRYRYKFINLDRTALILAAVWGLSIGRQCKK